MMFIKLIITTIIYLSFPSYFVSPLSAVRPRNSSDSGSPKWHVFIFHLLPETEETEPLPLSVHQIFICELCEIWIDTFTFIYCWRWMFEFRRIFFPFVRRRAAETQMRLCLCSVERRIACVLVWKIVILIFVFIDICFTAFVDILE